MLNFIEDLPAIPKDTPLILILQGSTTRAAAIRRPVPKKAYWLASLWAAYCLALCIGLSRGPAEPDLIAGMCLEAVAGIIPLAAVLLARKRAGTRGRQDTRVTLSAEGYAQGDLRGEITPMQWLKNMEAIVLHEDGDIYRLQIDRFTPVGTEDWAAQVKLFFVADPARAADIRRRIQDWRTAANCL